MTANCKTTRYSHLVQHIHTFTQMHTLYGRKQLWIFEQWEDGGARPRAGTWERKERGDGLIDGVIKIAWVSM